MRRVIEIIIAWAIVAALCVGWAKAQDMAIPFSVVPAKNWIMVPTTFHTWLGDVPAECALDTAATGIWVSDSFAARLAVSSPWPDDKFPPVWLRASVGNVHVEQWGWNWHTLGGQCLIGLDVFWSRYVCFDFQAGLLMSADQPWDILHAHYEACSANLNAWIKRAQACEERLSINAER